MNHVCALLFALAALCAIVEPAMAARPGDFADYIVISSVGGEIPAVKSVRLTALAPPAGVSEPAWRMDVLKQDGTRFCVWGISQHYPLDGVWKNVGRVRRCLLRVGTGPVLDYRDAHAGGALLPRQSLASVLLPQPPPPTLKHSSPGFLPYGTYLGHALALAKEGHEAPEKLPSHVTRLDLDPTLLVGTGRHVKDDGTGRDGPEGDYHYVPLQNDDFDRLIAAGHNYFLPDAKQLKWIIDRPVFFVISPEISDDTRYPELLYRSNYWSNESFYDEPGVLFHYDSPAGVDITNPAALANALSLRSLELTKDGPQSGNLALEHALRSAHISLGTLKLRQPNTPTWETVYDSASYQLQGGAHAVIHEGRYDLKDFDRMVDGLAGPGLKPTADEMLLFYYAFLRGAARVWGGEWGMSIYGQSEPALRQQAMDLAYSMGASYIWFWTSDHAHHVPFADQLALAAGLKRYENAHPKRNMHALLRRADTAIVMPYGYLIAQHQWSAMCMGPGYINARGAPYTSIPATVLFEFIKAVREGHDVDIVPGTPAALHAAYRQIIRVHQDGSVAVSGGMPFRGPQRVRKPLTGSLTVRVKPAADTTPPAGVQICQASDVQGHPPVIDGRLDDWKAAHWTRLPVTLEGAPDPKGGFAASVAVAFDRTHMYFAARVHEDFHWAPYGGWDMWRDDCIQLAIDPLCQRSASGYDWDDHEIGFALTPAGARAYRWHSPAVNFVLGGSVVALGCGPMSGFPLAIRRDEASRVTAYEAAIPLSMLYPLSLKPGGWVGFNVIAHHVSPNGSSAVIGLAPGIAGPKKDPSQFAVLRLTWRESWGPLTGWLSADRVLLEAGPLAIAHAHAAVCLSRNLPVELQAAVIDSSGRVREHLLRRVDAKAGLQTWDISVDARPLNPGRYTLRLSVIAAGRTVLYDEFRMWLAPLAGR